MSLRVKSLIYFMLSLITSASLMADSKISTARQQELRRLLQHDCGSCHGLTMRGGLGPALLPEALHTQSPEALAATILKGRAGTAMPAWQPLLSPQEARWIVDILLQQN